ncbi:phosphoglycerate dehydrogenase [Lamprobacter modestohalophilus]|uniref:Phosphoglycerate dehydrogenase n=1 Tax=Lamprobacter modestohalophilus TaxID=1064514 RepID=A0A9X1B410_9GAMM|nr:phosphoglycerate dehydrogenase [Lamprobacter modestohalophilus]MBK1618569.1 phosphoglycerate dehydrogenase [Lamprobacter modestohalophilus]
MNILVTCPPMLGMIDSFQDLFAQHGLTVTAPKVVQTLSVEELIELVPQHDGWIIGDDPATRAVFEAGQGGRLKAAVKWGIGVDNVDFAACQDLGIPITNTPNMFGAEVADIAMGYVIALARETFEIDRAVRAGHWPKPRGISIAGKTVALVGFGDIGRNAAQRMLAADMRVIAYDPFAPDAPELSAVERADWPQRLPEADFIVVTSALTASSRHLVNAETLALAKPGVRVVNVGRGPVIDEPALEAALASGQVYSAALDVFEIEPLPAESSLRQHPRCVFGSHNASNTADAVARTSEIAIGKLAGFLAEISREG